MDPTSWLIIRKSDSAVIGSQFDRPADVAVNLGLFDIKPWWGSPVQASDPLVGRVVIDPTLNNPTWQALYDAWSDGLAAAGGAKQWYIDHPNAAQLFELSIADLDTAIQNRNAAAETLLLKTLAIAVRVLAKREGLV